MELLEAWGLLFLYNFAQILEEKAGIKSGDFLESINGVAFDDLPRTKTDELFGKYGTQR